MPTPPHHLEALRKGYERPPAALHRGRPGRNGERHPREDGFDITVASEVMAIFCLAKKGISDLEKTSFQDRVRLYLRSASR